MLGFFSTVLEMMFDKMIGMDDTDDEHYPFDPSLRSLVPSSDSPLFVLRLLRDIAEDLDISLTEVEILILLATDAHLLNARDVAIEVDHVTPATVKRLLRGLCRKGLVYSYSIGNEDPYYGLSGESYTVIRSYYKD